MRGPLCRIGNRRQEPVARRGHPRARVHKRKAARAIGRFHKPLAQTSLAHRCRLLVAGDARDGQPRPEEALIRHTIVRNRILDLRQQRGRHVQRRQQLAVPRPLRNVVEQRARSVGRIRRVHRSPREPIDEPAIDRPEGKLAVLRPLPRPRHMVENPRDLRSRKIGVKQQARARGKHGLEPLVLEPRTQPRGAPVLPDDGIVDRLACAPVPDHGRLALVRDPDRTDRRQCPAFDRALDDMQRRLPDLLRVMLDPAILRIDLPVLLLGRTQDRPVGAEQDGAARGGALVYA